MAGIMTRFFWRPKSCELLCTQGEIACRSCIQKGVFLGVHFLMGVLETLFVGMRSEDDGVSRFLIDSSFATFPSGIPCDWQRIVSVKKGVCLSGSIGRQM